MWRWRRDTSAVLAAYNEGNKVQDASNRESGHGAELVAIGDATSWREEVFEPAWQSGRSILATECAATTHSQFSGRSRYLCYKYQILSTQDCDGSSKIRSGQISEAWASLLLFCQALQVSVFTKESQRHCVENLFTTTRDFRKSGSARAHYRP